MEEQVPFGFDQAQFVDNPEPRVPCVLLLDVSTSMGGSPISELNAGLLSFKEELSSDTLARKRAEIAIVTFGERVEVAQEFITAEFFSPPVLRVNGATPMGEAIRTGVDLVAQRKQIYKASGIAYYRPWIFLLTDGGPTDEWRGAAELVRRGEQEKSFSFFAVGVQGANVDLLGQIATRPPLKLQGLQFRELFLWLSQSLQSVSRSSPGEGVKLAPPGWTEV